MRVPVRQQPQHDPHSDVRCRAGGHTCLQLPAALSFPASPIETQAAPCNLTLRGSESDSLSGGLRFSESDSLPGGLSQTHCLEGSEGCPALPWCGKEHLEVCGKSDTQGAVSPSVRNAGQQGLTPSVPGSLVGGGARWQSLTPLNAGWWQPLCCGPLSGGRGAGCHVLSPSVLPWAWGGD